MVLLRSLPPLFFLLCSLSPFTLTGEEGKQGPRRFKRDGFIEDAEEMKRLAGEEVTPENFDRMVRLGRNLIKYLHKTGCGREVKQKVRKGALGEVMRLRSEDMERAIRELSELLKGLKEIECKGVPGGGRPGPKRRIRRRGWPPRGEAGAKAPVRVREGAPEEEGESLPPAREREMKGGGEEREVGRPPLHGERRPLCSVEKGCRPSRRELLGEGVHGFSKRIYMKEKRKVPLYITFELDVGDAAGPGRHGEKRRGYDDPDLFTSTSTFILDLQELFRENRVPLQVQVGKGFLEEDARKGERVLRSLEKRGAGIGIFIERWEGREEVLRMRSLLDDGGVRRVVSATLPRSMIGSVRFLKDLREGGIEVLSLIPPQNGDRGDAAPYYSLFPWRPASDSSGEEFVKHNPAGLLLLLPSGPFNTCCAGAGILPHPFAYGSLDYITGAIEKGLEMVDMRFVNHLHVNIFPESLRNPLMRDNWVLATFNRWFEEVMKPLVKRGAVKFVNYNRLMKVMRRWEKKNPGAYPVR